MKTYACASYRIFVVRSLNACTVACVCSVESRPLVEVYVYACDVPKSRGQKCTQAREGQVKWSTNAAYDVNWKLRYNYAFPSIVVPNRSPDSANCFCYALTACHCVRCVCVCMYMYCKYYVQAQQTLTSLLLLPLSLLLLLLLLLLPFPDTHLPFRINATAAPAPENSDADKAFVGLCVSERASASDGVIESTASRAPSAIKREGVRVVVLCSALLPSSAVLCFDCVQAEQL